MFKFIPDQLLARALGQEADAPPIPVPVIDQMFERLLSFYQLVDQGKLRPAQRSALRGHIFWEGPLLSRTLARALRRAPHAFPELQDALALAAQIEACQAQADAWHRLGKLCRKLAQICDDRGDTSQASGTRLSLRLLKHDRESRRAPAHLHQPTRDPDRDLALASTWDIFDAWRRRLRGSGKKK